MFPDGSMGGGRYMVKVNKALLYISVIGYVQGKVLQLQ